MRPVPGRGDGWPCLCLVRTVRRKLCVSCRHAHTKHAIGSCFLQAKTHWKVDSRLRVKDKTLITILAKD